MALIQSTTTGGKKKKSAGAINPVGVIGSILKEQNDKNISMAEAVQNVSDRNEKLLKQKQIERQNEIFRQQQEAKKQQDRVNQAKHNIANGYLTIGSAIAQKDIRPVGVSYDDLTSKINGIYNNASDYARDPDKYKNVIDTALSLQPKIKQEYDDISTKYSGLFGGLNKEYEDEYNRLKSAYDSIVSTKSQLAKLQDIGNSRKDAESVLSKLSQSERDNFYNALQGMSAEDIASQLKIKGAEDDSFFERADKATWSGVAQAGTGLNDLINSVADIGRSAIDQVPILNNVADFLFGDYDPEQGASITPMNKSVKESLAQSQTETLSGASVPEQLALQTIQSVSNMVPQMLIGTGLSGMVLSNPTLTSTLLKLPGINGNATKIPVAVTSASQALMQTFGSNYQEKREEGYDPIDSAVNTVFKTITSFYMNQFPTGNLLDIVNNKFKGNAISFLISSVVTQGLEESIEEGAEFFADDIVDSITLGTESRFVNDTANFLMEGLNNMLIGALAGGVMGGVSATTANIRTARQLNAVKRDINLITEFMAKNDLDEETRATLENVVRTAKTSAEEYLNRTVIGDAVQFESDRVPEVTYDQVMNTLNKMNAMDLSEAEVYAKAEDLLNQSMQMMSARGVNMDAVSFANLDEDTKQQVLNIQDSANELGAKVKFDTNASEAGHYDPKTGEILINPLSKNGSLSVFMHELTHTIEGSQYYSELGKLLTQTYGDDVKQAKKIIKDRYAQSGKNLTDEGVDQEFVAIQAQESLADENFVKRLVNYNSSLAYRLYEGIRNLTKSSSQASQIEYNFLKAFRDVDPNTLRNRVNGLFTPQTNNETGLQYAIDLKGALQKLSSIAYNASGKLKSIKEQVSDYFSGKFKRYDLLVARENSNGLGDYGLDESRPMTMRQSVIDKIFSLPTGTKHAHGDSINGDIADYVVNHPENIVFAVKNDWGNYAFIYDVPGLDGNPVLMSINENRKPGAVLEINDISSMYGKRNLQDYIDDCESRGFDIILNEKSDDFALVEGVRFPLSSVKITTSNNNISNNDQNVKNSLGLTNEDLKNHKQKQLDIVLKANSATDDYHAWIRTVDDIKTYEEALSDFIDTTGNSDVKVHELFPDVTSDDIANAIKTRKLTVYSSHPIENGAWVTPSKMEAKDYAGNGQVYSKEINLDDVAWLDATQGMYAKVTDNSYPDNFKPLEEIYRKGEAGSIRSLFNQASRFGAKNGRKAFEGSHLLNINGKEYQVFTDSYFAFGVPHRVDLPISTEDVLKDSMTRIFKSAIDNADSKISVDKKSLLNQLKDIKEIRIDERLKKKLISLEENRKTSLDADYLRKIVNAMGDDITIHYQTKGRFAENKPVYITDGERIAVLAPVRTLETVGSKVIDIIGKIDNKSETVLDIVNRIENEVEYSSDLEKFFNNRINKQRYSEFMPSQLNSVEGTDTARTLYKLDRQAKELKPMWDKSQKELIKDIRDNLGYKVVKLNLDPNFKYKELGNVIIDPGAKSIESAVKKVYRKVKNDGKTDYNLSDIKDHNRLSIQATNLNDLQRLIDYIQKRYNADLEVKQGGESGYIGFHLTWTNPNGIKNEVQIAPDFDIKQESERLYQDIRNIDRNNASSEELELIDKANSDSRKLWNQLANDFGLTPEVMANISSSETGLRESMNGKSYGNLTNTQEPVLEEKNSTTLPAIDNTISPNSSLKNPFMSLPPSDSNSITQRSEVNTGSNQYFKPGENPDRDVKIEKETAYGNTNRFARTEAESQNLSDEQVELLQAEIGKGKFAYNPVSNKTLVDNANSKLDKMGIDKMYENYIENHNQSARSIAEGELLLQQLAKSDNEKALKVASIVAGDLTEAGRAVQSARIFKRLSPEGKLLSVEQARNRIQEQLDARYGKGAQEINIDEKLKQDLLNAKTQEEADEAVTKIEEEIAKQMPSDVFDKMNAWRYFAMLANPRTHIRNILGNAVFAPIIDTKNFIGSAVETIVSKVNPKFERVKTSLNPMSQADKALVDFGKTDYENYKSKFEQQGKYAIDEAIKNKRTYFKDKGIGKIANKLINKSSDLLDAEDLFFSKNRYAKSLAEYLKSHGVTAEQASNPPSEAILDIVTKGQEYAYQESLKATYRDDSKIAKKIAELENTNKFTRFIFGGIMPFKKTPINIVKRGIEYSPAGLVKALYNGAFNLKNGKITANDLIDQLSAGLAGSGILMLGMFLASKGILRTNDDDSDRKEKFDSDMGSQDYSLVFPFGSYTIDWLSPSIMPLAMGVELFNLSSDETADYDLGNIADAFMRLADPITETSMLKNASDILTQYGENGTQKLGALMGDVVVSYINQFFPTLGGQVARTIDDTRRTTYPNEGFFDSFARQLMNKIPGASFLNEPYVNRHGETEKQEDLGLGVVGRLVLNMISPGYYNSNLADEYDDEYYRLYDQTGNLDAFPTNSTNKISADGIEYELSPKDYTKYQQEKWSKEKQMVDEFIDSDIYDDLSDQEKVDIIGKIRSYNSSKTKYEYLAGKGVTYSDPTVEKVESALEKGLPVYEYFMADSFYKGLSGNSKQSDYIDYLNSLDVSDSEKNALYDAQYGDSASTIRVNDFADDYGLSDSQEMGIKRAMTTQSLKDANGETIRNSKALQVRNQYEEMGIYDDVLDYISKNGLDAGDFGLNKTVVGYSDSKFNYEYSSLYGSGAKTGIQSSGSSRSSRRSGSRSRKVKDAYGVSEDDYNKAIQSIDNIYSKIQSKIYSNADNFFDIEIPDIKELKIDISNELKLDTNVKDLFKKYSSSMFDDLIDSYLEDHPYSNLFEGL